MTIQEIINQLQNLGEQLESGNISSDNLIHMTSLSHDLYERMVILRHKAHEEIVNAEDEHMVTKEPVEELIESDISEAATSVMEKYQEIVEDKQRVSEPSIEDRPAIPIGSAEISPNQISLIDSIEEIKQNEQSINDQFKNDEHDISLAATLQQTPIDDMVGFIGINQKFRFISELFNDDQQAYDLAIDRLNTFNSYLEADEYLQNSLSEQYGWDLKDSLVKELADLTQRRYL